MLHLEEVLFTWAFIKRRLGKIEIQKEDENNEKWMNICPVLLEEQWWIS